MDTAIAIVSAVIALASLLTTWWLARRAWTEHDREAIEQMRRELGTVDYRIRDACHERVKRAEFQVFASEVRNWMRGK